MDFKTAELTPQQNYRLLNGGVTPRPIAWISTRSAEGIDNLAPYSFFTVASCNPPVLLYTQVTQRNGNDKDTLVNLKQTGECVVNIVSSDLMLKANMTSAALEGDISEFEHAEVQQCKSALVSVSSVKESPVRYECTLREIRTISELPTGGTIVLLDVKSIYVRDDLFLNDAINQHQIDSVGKLGGDAFAVKPAIKELKRP
jgi:flavin reductase (DIM6/NTAB) family NADH-FMN oxidoreductase RutF